MSLSFVGSSKCYTIVKFVTLPLYQYDFTLSTGFLGFFPTSPDLLHYFLTSGVILPLFLLNYFVTFLLPYSLLYDIFKIISKIILTYQSFCIIF